MGILYRDGEEETLSLSPSCRNRSHKMTADLCSNMTSSIVLSFPYMLLSILITFYT